MKRHFAFGLIVLMLASLACETSLTTPIPLPPSPDSPTAIATITLTPLPTQTQTPTITPTPPLTASSGPVLLALHMFSATRGWGLTENQILITRDGGLTWAQVPLPGVKIDSSVSAYFINLDIAYFFAPISGAKIGQLFATRDGGATWEINPTPFSSAKLYFFNDNIGFALQTLNITGSQMTVAIYQTLDRGINWTQVFTHTASQDVPNLPAEGIKTGMSFIDSSQGFIGLSAQANDVGLYHAQDAGRTWIKQELPLPDDIGDPYQSTVWPAFFFSKNGADGFLPVDFVAGASGASTRVFYVTHDAGMTWEKAGEIPEGTVYFFYDPQVGWVWSGRTVYITNDGAKTWNPSPIAFSRNESASLINFSDPKNGWLITIDAKKNILRLYRTYDGGGTWTAMVP